MSKKVRIAYISDVHMELGGRCDYDSAFVEGEPDYIVIAGDLSPFPEDWEVFFSELLGRCERAQVIFVPGNHEYYKLSMAEANQRLFRLEEALNETMETRGVDARLHVMGYKASVLFRGLAFIGLTGWYMPKTPMAEYLFEVHMNDKNIRINENERLSIDSVKDLAKVAALNLDLFFHLYADYKCVVVTHMVPGEFLLHETPFAGHPLNEFFVNDELSDVLFKRRSLGLPANVSLWIFGHTHCPIRARNIDGIDFLCNPGFAIGATVSQKTRQAFELTTV